MSSADSDRKPEEQAKPAGALPVLLPVFAGVFYALSPFPLYCILMRLPEPVPSYFESVFEIAYIPLEWLYENFDVVEKFYDWYGNLFDL